MSHLIHSDSPSAEPRRPNLSRRKVLSLGAVATGTALASCGKPGSSGSAPASGGSRRVRWNLASSFGSSLRAMYGAAERLCENVERMSGGTFQIRLYEAGELVPALQVLDAVQDGSIHAGQTAGYYYTGKNPLKRVRDNSEEVTVAKTASQRALHKAFLRYHDPNNWPRLREALKSMGRSDLIGNGKHQLIPSYQPKTDGSYNTARRKNSTPVRKRPKKGTILSQHTGLPPRES